MGLCSLILVSVVLMHHGTLKPTPLDDITVNLNLNDVINGGPEIESEEWKTGKTAIKDSSCYKKRNQRQGQEMGEKRKRLLGGQTYVPGLREGLPDYEHWMASIRTVLKDGRPGICGGALISPQHVLTALHCIYDVDTEKFYSFFKVKIYFDPDKLRRWGGTAFRPAEYFFVEGENKKPEYLVNCFNIFGKDPKCLKDDIAVIKLKLEKPITEFKHTSSLKPIQISKLPGKKVAKVCEYWKAGFGTFRLPDEVPAILQYTKNIPYEECPEKWYIRQDTMMCFENTNKDAFCDGDSGSPGVIELNKNSWALQSIHSTGNNCSDPIGRALDIDVSYYATKIAEWTNQES